MKLGAPALAWAALLILARGAACADVVTDWNVTAVAAGYAAHLSPDQHSRALAIMQIAVFDALDAIEPRYTPYRSRLAAAAGASPEAAAATAAHAVLVRLWPDQAKDLDAALQASLGALPEGAAKADGMELGERAARAILDERANDGSEAPNTYRPFTAPGQYVPTVLPASSTWGAVRPFAIKSGDQFRPPAPYALGSAEWARDYNEIKALGRKTGSARTAAQTDIARFWQLVGPATTHPVVRQIAAARHLDLLDTARVLALTAMAGADAAIAVFDAKYTYNFWRPITAIRNGDLDGNDATERDASWEPFATTPMHPEYPCAHCIFVAATTSVLQALYGDAPAPFTMTSTTAPGLERRFERLSDYVADVINGRVYEGVHYRTSGEVGAAMGRRIGEYTVQHTLKPAPAPE